VTLRAQAEVVALLETVARLATVEAVVPPEAAVPVGPGARVEALEPAAWAAEPVAPLGPAACLNAKATKIATTTTSATEIGAS
jgi:hypothetical protein